VTQGEGEFQNHWATPSVASRCLLDELISGEQEEEEEEEEEEFGKNW